MISVPAGTAQFCDVPPAGFEPALPPPEGGALSPELRGPNCANQPRDHRTVAEPPSPPRSGDPRPTSTRSWTLVGATALIGVQDREEGACARSALQGLGAPGFEHFAHGFDLALLGVAHLL